MLYQNTCAEIIDMLEIMITNSILKHSHFAFRYFTLTVLKPYSLYYTDRAPYRKQ